MKYTVLDPTDEQRETCFQMARRPANLMGLTLGVIDNGKKNADYILRKVSSRLHDLCGVASTVYVKKPSASNPITGETARELAAKCQVTIVGVGD
jgi:hypothetical protein